MRMLFVILTGPWVEAPGEWGTLRRAQAAAARRPEFAGTVAFVSTHEFVRRPEDSPNPGHGHHEFGNAETGLRVGVALGRAMVELPEREKTPPPSQGVKPTRHVTRPVEGWTVRVDDRLLAPPHDETGRRARRFLEARLFDIRAVVPPRPLEHLQRVVLVLDLSHGDLTAMHYGLTDPKEFFAEMTEAFFGSNDFQPFNWAELRTAEPAIYDLLESVWRKEAPVTTH